jgi:3'(2'), 5'-bisphosphate nucleotidase
MSVMTSELSFAITAAQSAGTILMKHFRSKLDIATKADAFDYVTQADTESDAYLRNAISSTFPKDAILSEESAVYPSSYINRVWMVDPLDGTKDFIAERDTFSVIIGLLTEGVPTIGVVYLPARNELLCAQKGSGAFRIANGSKSPEPIHASSVKTLTDARMSVRIPTKEVRPLEDRINKLAVKERIPGGSIGSRACDIACNKIDVFINTNHRASKWDTLGCEVILNESGGLILDLKGQPLDYSSPKETWEDLFVIACSQELATNAIHEVRQPIKHQGSK